MITGRRCASGRAEHPRRRRADPIGMTAWRNLRSDAASTTDHGCF